MTNYSTLTKSMKEEHLWPPSRDNIVYFHRGSWWNNYNLLQECFEHQLKDIQETIGASQFLQYGGLRYAVESNRRRAFRNSGSIMWQFNEPYPNNYCTSCVDYYRQPKPAYYGVQKAYESFHVSAAFTAQALAGFQSFEVDIYLHNSTGVLIFVGLCCRIIGVSGTEYAHQEIKTEINLESKKVLSIYIPLKNIREEQFFLILDCKDEDGNAIASNW